MRQATASWQWVNFLESQAPAGKRIVHLNMDESSVKLYPVQCRRGAIALSQSERLKDVCARTSQVSLAVRRRAVTLVAFLADDCEVQRSLPQIVVGADAEYAGELGLGATRTA